MRHDVRRTAGRGEEGVRDLHAYADGLLEADPDRKAAVEEMLARDAAARRLVRDVRGQNAALRRVLGVARTDVGARTRLDRAIAGSALAGGMSRAAASGILMLAIGLIAGFAAGRAIDEDRPQSATIAPADTPPAGLSAPAMPAATGSAPPRTVSPLPGGGTLPGGQALPAIDPEPPAETDNSPV